MINPINPEAANVSGELHQVLARKCRPRNFEQMVGQEHVLRALINAFNNNRLHHAYLFTGTRGVGKTTLARILAKCLNCLAGVSATPCGCCEACVTIDQGRFVDLIEVDAASRTKVEDTRELLDNVQYLPTNGRYKIYLIDEVHMLSGHSFNALLKTLEEPPAHVKFLLATTDPHKLPVTVLSRCLQFHLKNLAPARIAKHLANVLQQENIAFDDVALQQLGKAADGSMRDGLSLLDQAIAYSSGHISQADVSAMLGIVEQQYIEQIFRALTANNATALIECCAHLAGEAADFNQALEDLLALFHQIALAQAVPDSINEQVITEYAKLIAGEELQLYYQIGIIGRRDLPLAPTPQIGFEMILLRMLSYRPVIAKQTPSAQIQPPATTIIEKKNLPEPVIITAQAPVIEAPLEFATAANPIITEVIKPIAEPWSELLQKLKLTGLSHTLAMQCMLKEITDTQVQLILDASFSAMLSQKLQQTLNDAFNHYLDKPIKLKIEVGASNLETPALIKKRQHAAQHQAAVNNLQSDLAIQQLIQNFDAKIELSTVQLK